VFTQFKDVQAAYRLRLNKAAPGIPLFELSGAVPANERQGVVNAWKNVAGPAVICCMLQVAGVGLNMTAARHGSFLDELFVPGLNQQAIDRLNRIGASTTQAIQIRKYIARNTIDSRIQAILGGKTKLTKTLIETDPDWKRKVLKALREEQVA
jgi:SNF2 family DNA or RNA helicase